MDKTTKTWKTIKLGTGLVTPDDFIAAFGKANTKQTDAVINFISSDSFTVEKAEKEVKLALLSVFDLGFENTATADECIAQARKIGLAVCPPEVGPQLRLQYTDQPRGECVLIGMEPVTDGTSRSVFSIEHSDETSAIDEKGLLLYLYNGGPQCEWTYNNKIVFLIP